MAAVPQETGTFPPTVTETRKDFYGDEVVISGISGVFPSSDNTTQFLENLLNNVDLVVQDNLNFNHPEAPKYYGKINGKDKFDAQFFRVTYAHAQDMEPQSRMLLEQAYMAMYDSGINPLAYRGKKVGVYIGSSYSDKSNEAMFNQGKAKGFILSGCGKSMFANRISYWIDGKGPSYNLDSSCTSAMVCFEIAYNAIKAGECEAAVVGGSNVCLDPNLGLNLRRYGTLSIDGKTRCFDKNADGAVRSEAVNCIFLQKAKDAKRIYAEVVYAKSTYALKNDAKFLPLRRHKDLEDFLHDCYLKSNVCPKEVEYVEANGAAVPDADFQELKAIDNVFAKDSKVKVGSVKSNMGNSDAASGVCALTKVCLAYHKGTIPANLHYSESLNVPGVKEGRIEVLKANSSFKRGYAAVNAIGSLGTNCHVLLKGRHKPKDIKQYECSIPRLVLVSGRQEECVNKIFDILENQPFDPEVIGMLHNIYRIETPGHTSRGYMLFDKDTENKTMTLVRNSTYYPGTKRPLWLVFSGMGSQWPGMATDLMKMPVFAAAIKKCHRVLKPFGVDLINILTSPDKSTFDKILHCFIGITAVQIGLTDLLKAIGIQPNYVIGHSQGEMACAYFDDTFTTEETILAAYSRGLVSSETHFVKGAMAAVGLGYKDIKPLCPPEIDIACHNSNTSATLSGPADIMKEFVAELTAKGIFAREVPSTGIAFHSRYIRHAGPAFLEKLKKIIQKPKLRSPKWISTSVPEENWDCDLAKYSSAEYHTNNLMSSVLFEEASQHIPDDAVILEVAPHGLLQAILKRSHPNCVNITLTKRGETDQLKYFFNSLGQVYQEGFSVEIDALYPQIQYPVSTETPMISHFVEWEHSENWKFIASDEKHKRMATSREVLISVHDEVFNFLSGYIRDGINVFPESAVLFFIWETLAIYRGVKVTEMSIQFSDIQFHGVVDLHEDDILKLQFTINKGNDYFEVTTERTLLASGYVAEVVKPKVEILHETETNSEDDNTFNAKDLYAHLNLKGMTYRNDFQSILKTNLKGGALVKWTENWITFLDGLFQLNILSKNMDGIATPKLIKKLTINLEETFKEVPILIDNLSCYNAKYYEDYEITRCAGIEIRHLIFENNPTSKLIPDVLESLSFVPYSNELELSVESALLVILQIIADNLNDDIIHVTEINEAANENLGPLIESISKNILNINIEIENITTENIKYNEKTNLIIIQDRPKISFNKYFEAIGKHSFILTVTDLAYEVKNGHFTVISTMKVKNKELVLLKKVEKITVFSFINVQSSSDFDWVPRIQSEFQKTHRVILVSERQPHCGLFGLVKKIQKKYSNKIGVVVIDDFNAPAFDKENPVFKNQLQKGLTFNVLLKNQWGNYFYLPRTISSNANNFELTNCLPGYIDSLRWSEKVSAKTNDNMLVQVCFAGPSIRDTQKAVGSIENIQNGFGYDFSGFDKYGKRVMGLVQGGAIASTVKPDSDLLWPVPEYWTLEEAATVPLPYVHACYILAIKGQVQKGHTIFVNGGAGALGQAIISICLSLQCKVFTSVSDAKKKGFLLKLFPQLEEKNIGCSINGDFKDLVLLNTQNKRCNFVINCASGELRTAAMKCVAACGVFIDVSVHDHKENQGLGMSYGEEEKNYISTRLQTIFDPKNVIERKKLQLIVTQGIINGMIRPLTRVVYPIIEVCRAFRLLSSNRHRGRVLLKIKDAEVSSKCLNLIPRVAYSSKGSYVIVCDESDLGIELANRLVRQGAKKLILHFKSKNVPGLLHLKLASWKKHEASVKISTENLHLDRNCVQLLKDAQRIGPVQGLFIVTEKSGATISSQKDFVEKYQSLTAIIANLDVISRNNCPELSIFAVLSRSPQNDADAYASSAVDKICQLRRSVGLPATSFKVEYMDELQQNGHSDKRLKTQSVTTVLNALEISIKQQLTNVITYNLKENKTNFYNTIAKCLGIHDLNNIDENLLVCDFLTSDVNVIELKNAIKKSYGLEYTYETLRRFSIARLKALNKKSVIKENTIKNGLEEIFTFVDDIEHRASDVMVPLKTLVDANELKETNELDGTAAHLLLIPGFDGHHNIFKQLSQRLKLRAMAFQHPLDTPDNSIYEMAFNIYKNIKKTFVFNSKFYLLGYSFGVNIALELAALLEKDGHRGVVFCLDGSPDSLPLQLESRIGIKTDNELQDIVVDHMYKLMTGDTIGEVFEETSQLNSWNNKIAYFINKVKRVASYSIEYQRQILDNAYKRILLTKYYRPTLTLQSQIVLLKCTHNDEKINLESDYGLSKFCDNTPVKVYEINSNHANLPHNVKIPSIINAYLDPNILDEFKSINLCYKYLAE